MTNKTYNKRKSEAEKLVSKIDKFIEDIIEVDKYGYPLSLMMKRLLKKAGDSDMEDICFELDIEANIKTFKIDSLAQEIRLEKFLDEIKANPYQLQLIA